MPRFDNVFNWSNIITLVITLGSIFWAVGTVRSEIAADREKVSQLQKKMDAQQAVNQAVLLGLQELKVNTAQQSTKLEYMAQTLGELKADLKDVKRATR